MKNNVGASLAEKIAKLIESESQNSDVASLFASIEKLDHRLKKLESDRSAALPFTTHTIVHPSQDRFEIAEAIVDRLFDKNSKEKDCTFEPNGRPCDHCSMCSSLGF